MHTSFPHSPAIYKVLLKVLPLRSTLVAEVAALHRVRHTLFQL